MSTEPTAAGPRRQLTLVDTTAIIVGIIIGSSIYKASPTIAGAVPSTAALLAVWFAGGLVTLIGSLCYAELASSWPAEGGDYAYLSRTFGRPVGFLFAWSQLFIVRPGSIGAMAFVFAEYAQQLAPLKAHGQLIYAATPIVLFTAINMLGVQIGAKTQIGLTAAKVLGLLLVVAIGLAYRSPTATPVFAVSTGDSNWYLAAVLIFFAYGGWNDMAYVSAEVEHPHKNILRSLLLGTVTVTLVYVLVTVAFVHALGFAGMTRGSEAIAAQVAQLALGKWGGTLVGVLVCISALGAVNGMLFGGARIYSAWGREYPLLSWMGKWSPRFGTPLASLAVQGTITLALVVNFGMQGKAGFESAVLFTVPVFFVFLFLVGLSVYRLRRLEPDRPRPFKIPGYPWTLLIFCGSSGFMTYASVAYALTNRSSAEGWAFALLGAGVLLAAIFGIFTRKRTGRTNASRRL